MQSRKTTTLKDRPHGTQSLESAMSILLEFSNSEGPLGVTELARKLGVNKSSVSRQLKMLSRIAFVVRDHDSAKYVLGMGLLPLAASVLAKHQLNAAARLRLEELAAEVSETVTVSGWNGHHAINLANVDPPGAPHSVVPPGRINPFHSTATGKLFLAMLPKDELEERLKEPLPRYTENTICDPNVLRAEVAKIRRNHYATAKGEFIARVCSVAVHTASRDGVRSYALAVTMPIESATNRKIDTAVKALHSAASDVSRLLEVRS